MACNGYIELLQRFLDSDLEGAELGRFQEHLRMCPSCRGRVERHQQREKLLRDRVRAGLPTGHLAPKVMPRLAIETAGPLRSPLFKLGIVLVAVAVALAVWLSVAKHPAPILPEPPMREPLPGGPYEPGFPAIIAGAGGCMLDSSHLKAGLRLTIKPNELAQFLGQAVYSPEPGQEITMQGRSTGIFTRDAILWQNGDAEFAFKLVKPFRVVVGDSYVTIRGTVVKFKGEVQGSVQVQLVRGAAELTTPQGTRSMQAGQVVDIRQTPIAQVPHSPLETSATAPEHPAVPASAGATESGYAGEPSAPQTNSGVSSVTLQGNPYEDAPVVVPEPH